MRVVRKAFAYVTHEERLLVFEHPAFPDAGIQVPAGTVKQGEDPADAALREAREETGLDGLVLAELLGISRRDMSDFGRDEVHERYFYHLRYGGHAPETWVHHETDPADGSGPIAFRFHWAPLPDGVPPLIAGHDRFLHRLVELLPERDPPGERPGG